MKIYKCKIYLVILRVSYFVGCKIYIPIIILYS